MPAATPPVRIALHGAPRYTLADGSGGPLEPKDALLLAWLAIEGPTARLRLATLFWPEADEARARNALRQRLHRLKKLLGADGVQGDAVLALGGALGVDREGDGELLAGIDAAGLDELGDWLLVQRERRGARRVGELTASAEQAELAGDLGAALQAAGELLALQPVSEPAFRRVMRLHYLRGDRAAALDAYARCVLALARGVGAAPSAETEALRALIEASEAPAPARAAVPVAVLRPPRLVGRAAELAALTATWRAEREFLLLGEAGAGKTRLLAELAQRMPAALSVAARPGDAGVPYAALARLLRALLARLPRGPVDAEQRAELARVLPELGPAPAADVAGGAAALRLQRALEALLVLARDGGVAALIVDDLHFADAASLESIAALQSAPALAGLRWGLAQRPNEGPPQAQAVAQTLEDARRLERVTLAPLAEPALAELVDSLAVPEWTGARLAAPLLQHSGGNPLFALETLKLMAQSGAAADVLPRPGSVAALIERRLKQLSAGALALARVAAVAETEFSIALAEHVLRSPALALADAWSELEGAQVLRSAGFAHDLVRESVLAGVPQAIAAHLHAAIAEFLDARGGSAAARVAAHFQGGGRFEQAAACWVRAGHEALTALRYGEAADAFERGARLFGDAGRGAEAFDAAYQMRQACFEIDLAARSEAALDLLDRFASTPVQRATADNERAVTLLHRGDMAGTEARAHAGLRALGGADEPLLRAELRRNLAAVFAWRNETHAALAELRAVQADIERLGSPALRFQLWQSLAILLDHADHCEEAQELHQRSIDLGIEVNNLPGAAQVALNLAVGLHDCGRARDALPVLERARLLLAGVPGAQASYSSLMQNYGLVLRALGDFGAALDHFERACEKARVQTPGWLPLTVAHRAQTLVYLGQYARAQQALAEAPVSAQTPLLAAAKWHAVQAMLRRAQGRSEPGALAEWVARQPAGGRRLSRWRLQLQALAHRAADADALAEAEQIAADAGQAGRHGVAIHAQVRAADIAQRLDDPARAEGHARSALALSERYSADDIYAGEVFLTCQRALQAAGAAERGDCLRRAADWVREASVRVPAEFRDSFLNRNAANRELLTAATRLPRLAAG